MLIPIGEIDFLEHLSLKIYEFALWRANVAGYTSLGYMVNKGIVRNTDFQRFTFRTNINGRSNNKRLTYSTQVSLGYS